MRAWPTISIIALWGILNTLCPAIADELHLSNGDVITGQLIRNDPSPDANEKWDSKLMFLLGWQFGN